MTLTKVLEMLYGKVASGYFQATYIENGKCRSKCFQIDQLSEIVDVDVKEIPITDTNNPERETGANRFIIKIAGGQILVDDSDYNGLECVARENYEKVNQTEQAGKEKGRLTRLTSEFSFSFPISFFCLGLAKP